MILIPVQSTWAAAAVNNCSASTSANQPGNLMYALNQGGIINFLCSGTLSLPSTFSITKNTTIDGANQSVTLSGKNTHIIFGINQGVTLVLKNVTLIDGSGFWGGAIANGGGKLIIENVTFKNNQGRVGGAIYSKNNGTVLIANSTFSHNVIPVGGASTGYNGGAINIENGSLAVTNSTFEDNAADNGGAIYNNQAVMSITNSHFKGNLARPTAGQSSSSGSGGDENIGTITSDEVNGQMGGAIYSNNYFTVQNSTFDNNSAYHEGGAIFSNGGQITGSTFTSNSTKFGHGGAIYDNELMLVFTSHFKFNTAHNGEGGAIFGSYHSTLTVSETELNYNTTNISGGAISSYGYSLDVISSTFNTNVAGQNGGAIATYRAVLKVYNSTLDNNAATKGSQLYTGSVSDVTLTNSTLSSDKSASNSTIENKGKVTLKNTIVSNYTGSVNCAGNAVVDGGSNLQFPKQTCGATIPSKDPLLAAIANNGGYTPTLALKAGSPAIDKGNSATCNSTFIWNQDQRGFARPANACDIGAYEFNATAK